MAERGERGGAQTCHGMVTPHALGSNRTCLHCSAHNAIKRAQSRPFETDEQWAERMAPSEVEHMDAINSTLPLPAPPRDGAGAEE